MRNVDDGRQERLPRTGKDAAAVIEAFKEGRELRTKKVIGDNHSPWYRTGRSGIRDMVKREGDALVYYLWGSAIATIEGDILTLDNCGYETRTTTDRLNRIFWRCCPDARADGYTSTEGWRLHYFTKLIPYPLMVNLRTQKVLNQIDLDEQYRHLLRMRSAYKIRETRDVLRKYGPIPAEIEDKVLGKLMAITLMEAA